MSIDEVKEKQNSAEPEAETSSSTTALTTLNTGDLDKESFELINQIIAESDIERTKDLTHLFNINQNKKTMIRIDKLSGLQDNLVNQFAKRIAERPDEISNKELMDGIKIVQDIIERGQKQVAGVNETPLIQINQQTNSVNIGDAPSSLNRESREKVKNAVLSLLNNINKATAEPSVSTDTNSEIIDVEDLTDDN
jgi:hypothetical protein